MNGRIRKLDWIDLGCVKAGAIFFALLTAKLWPVILSLPLWTYAVGLALVSIRPMARILSDSGGEEK